MKWGKFTYVMLKPQPTFATIFRAWRLHPNCKLIEFDESAGKRELGFVDRFFGAEHTGRHQVPAQGRFLLKPYSFRRSEHRRPDGVIKPTAMLGINSYPSRLLPSTRQPHHSGGKCPGMGNRTHDPVWPKRFSINATSDRCGWLSKVDETALRQSSASDEFLSSGWVSIDRKFNVAEVMPINCFIV
jgi:hypothetical protein